MKKVIGYIHNYLDDKDDDEDDKELRGLRGIISFDLDQSNEILSCLYGFFSLCGYVVNYKDKSHEALSKGAMRACRERFNGNSPNLFKIL